MIGVIADASQHDAVREFFELFKTPWEFYRKGESYDVLLCNGDVDVEGRARLVLVYSSRGKASDDYQATHQSGDCLLLYRDQRLPLYGGSVRFAESDFDLLTDENAGGSLIYHDKRGEVICWRIGYDLFAEVRSLLTVGQPVANAAIPTLEVHIALLRDLIIESGIALLEIPPVPDGYQLIACLTHDVDHPSIRHHGWDHTTLGFLCRAVFGSLGNVFRGRVGLGGLISNWKAALMLPFVQSGVAKDIWSGFGNQYLSIEGNRPSTFFVIPFAGRPGKAHNKRHQDRRAAKYGASDIANTLRQLAASNREIGLHGIDAWVDSTAGAAELAEIRSVTTAKAIGVRMHWLYFDQNSPRVLEDAGAAYDSTVGYNETVGYRAGTTQVFRPLGCSHLLELPLHAMDTALFYPSYLDLSPAEAQTTLEAMIATTYRYGGCLTTNWHDRSIAPERQWGGTYRYLVTELSERAAWFATAGDTAKWFAKRRRATFERAASEPCGVRVTYPAGDEEGGLPGLQIRINLPATASKVDGQTGRTSTFYPAEYAVN